MSNIKFDAERTHVYCLTQKMWVILMKGVQPSVFVGFQTPGPELVLKRHHGDEEVVKLLLK